MKVYYLFSFLSLWFASFSTHISNQRECSSYVLEINLSQHSAHSAASLQQERGIFISPPASGETGTTEFRNGSNFKFRHFCSSFLGHLCPWFLHLPLRRHVVIPFELLPLPRLVKDYSRFITSHWLYRQNY